MCRNCPMPEWGDPVTCRVADLPAYFARQISWNFERLNFGNATVIDTPSGRAERPTVTAKVGCRLKDNIKSEGTGRVPERYLLVSEVLYCPGKRYGCTPRENCTGKRRNCWAQCKITIYADQDDIAYICYSGSHGTGNVEDVSRHRPLPAVMREVKRQRVEGGATPGETVQWIRKFVEERGISKEDARFVLKESQLKSLVKRMSKGEGGSGIQGDAEGNDEETDKDELQNNNSEENTENWDNTQIVICATSFPDGDDGKSAEENELDSSVREKQGEESLSVDLSEVHVVASPLNTPLTSVPTTPVESTKVFRDGELMLGNLFATPQTTIANHSTQKEVNLTQVSTRNISAPTQSTRRTNAALQKQAKIEEVERLKQHVHILEKENLNKISQVAQLEVQLKLMQQSTQNDAEKLNRDLNKLREENNRKNARIKELEKMEKQNEIEKLKTELNKMIEENNRKNARIAELERMVQITYSALKQRETQAVPLETPLSSTQVSEKVNKNGNVILSVAVTSDTSTDLTTETS